MGFPSGVCVCVCVCVWTLIFLTNRTMTVLNQKEEQEKRERVSEDIDKSLNEAAADKIRKYRADYNNNPPNAISFIPAIASTSGRLHSEFIRLLFLQDHRETDRFLKLCLL